MEDFYSLNESESYPKQLTVVLLELISFLRQDSSKDQKFYDSADLKCLLNISDKTLYRMGKQGKIPFFKLGKKCFYPKSFFNQKVLW